MEVAFHKENYYALAMCMLAPQELSVDRACIKMGIKMEYEDNTVSTIERGTNVKIKGSELPKIVDLYFIDMKTTRKIADLYGVSKDCILKNLKKMGYKPRDKNGGREFKVLDIEEYKNLKKQGLKDYEIAEKMGCTPPTLCKNKKIWGLVR